MQDQLEKREGKFFYKGKKLIADLFTVSDFYYEVSGNKVEGKLRMGEKEISMGSCEAIFPGWFLYGGVLRKLPDEIDHEWIEMVYPHPKEVADKQFFKTLEKELRGMPTVVWKERPELPQVEAYPFLILKDRSGAFADLWMDYGESRQVAVHDTARFSWRSPELEKTWEKDLLETGFCKKWMEGSQYYCSLDQVTKSLMFLLELGWKIFDYQKKQVYRQGAKDLHLAMLDQHIILKGTISYKDHEVDVNSVLGAFNRRQQFVALSDNAVGLIDPMPYLAELPQEDGEVKVKKHHVGLLESLFSDGDIKRAPDMQSFIEKVKRAPGIVSIPASEAFQGTLYPYQQEGLNWLYFLYQSGFSGLLADEMGLGKTVQILALLSLLDRQGPVLIVVPTSLIFNWKREFERFLPSFSVYLHTGGERLKDLSGLMGKEVIITSYAILRLDTALLRSQHFACVILDEAQTIKNRTSQVAEAAYALHTSFRIAITGTPIENRWEDLESLFTFLMPELISAKHLMKRKIQPFLLRREKEKVALQLPEKIQQTILVEMTESQQAIYDEVLIKTKARIKNANRMEVLEAILRLRQVCCHPALIGTEGESAKYSRLFEDLEEVVASGRKVLVYSQFTTMLRLIEKGVIERQWSYAYLDGSIKNREEVVKEFQEGPASIFLISLKAGGVGLNLTAADYVFLYDPWWNDAVEAQAIDRAHRHGRIGTVIAKRYITTFTIEEKIMNLKSHKTALSRDLFNLDENEISMQDLYDLLN
jgi:superfamily II DNA or RNA helicase